MQAFFFVILAVVQVAVIAYVVVLLSRISSALTAIANTLAKIERKLEAERREYE